MYWRMTAAHKGTPRLDTEVTLNVDGRVYAIRTRNDDVSFILFRRGQVGVMLFNPKMFAYAAMSLFPVLLWGLLVLLFFVQFEIHVD